VGAQLVLVSSLLNLSATADFLARRKPEQLRIVCAGTGEGAALEDVLAAGVLCDALAGRLADVEANDSVAVAHGVYLQALPNFAAAVSRAKNGRRLLGIPELRADVEFCLRQDSLELVALCDAKGIVRKQS
jgi:phosphosulfolactate phosphohydrolase-like enzyme